MRTYNRTQLLLGVEHGLPIDSDLALAHFVARNPHWQGAHWADALDVLNDSDSHLEVTEPMWDALHERIVDNKRLIGLVAITLLWAWNDEPQYVPAEPWKRLPSPFDVEGKIAAVEAYLASQP